MALAKSCPGSRAIREPTPEYITCPNCGAEVEVWTHEISYPCSNCGTRVFREQRPSCIDWCPYAKECIGPQVYASLKPQEEGDQPDTKGTSPLDMLKREHEEALKQVDVLRAATLCLKIGARMALSQPSQTLDRGVSKLSQALEFFDNELAVHFRREEEFLSPILEKRIGREGNPTRLLLAELLNCGSGATV